MIKKELPIQIHQLALLQAYLYEVFGNEKECENSFKYSEWYLRENFTDREVDTILKFFKDKGLNCDCGFLKKIDLRELADKSIKFHN